MDMNLLVIKFEQITNTYKGYTYSKSIWYGFRFNFNPFVDMNFIVKVMHIQSQYDHIFFHLPKAHS